MDLAEDVGITGAIAVGHPRVAVDDRSACLPRRQRRLDDLVGLLRQGLVVALVVNAAGEGGGDDRLALAHQLPAPFCEPTISSVTRRP